MAARQKRNGSPLTVLVLLLRSQMHVNKTLSMQFHIAAMQKQTCKQQDFYRACQHCYSIKHTKCLSNMCLSHHRHESCYGNSQTSQAQRQHAGSTCGFCITATELSVQLKMITWLLKAVSSHRAVCVVWLKQAINE